MQDALKILQKRCDLDPILNSCYLKEKKKMVNFYKLEILVRWFVYNIVYNET